MKLITVCLLLAVASNSTLLNTLPTKVLIKNETIQPQFINTVIAFTVKGKGYVWTETKRYAKDLAAGIEIDVTQLLLPVSLGSILTIAHLVVEVSDKKVDLGDYSEIRITIQPTGIIVDPLPGSVKQRLATHLAAYVAIQNWWTRFTSSWSSFWSNLFTRKSTSQR